MSSDIDFTLQAQTRHDVGKGASRRLRREKKVPAVVYGGDQDAVSLTLSHDEVYRKLQFEAFFSHILTLHIDGGQKQQAILRDLQRHPFKPVITHMDFLRVQADREIQIRVPLHFINEEEAVGVRMHGGEISHLETEVEVICLPRALPEYLEVDVSGVDVGETLHLTDMPLPEGVQLVDLVHGEEQDRPIFSIHMPRVTADEEAEEEAGAEPEEGEEAAGDDSADAGDDSGEDDKG